MMARKAAGPELRVEGIDDLYTIGNLVERYGIDRKSNESVPEIHDAGSVEALLDAIATAISTSGGRTMGFVLDADAPLAHRWASIKQRLIGVGVEDVPELPPENGFIGESRRFKTQVGVWLMPDNLQDGTLENFLHSLIPELDPIIDHATRATEQAKEMGAQFREVDRNKAVIHTWLAWQKKPGSPYGTAVGAKYFQHDRPLAKKFVTWYSTLYGITDALTSE